MTEHPDICGNPNCASCARRLKFELPLEIPAALRDRRLVLFAGAGISTESRGVFPSTFFEEIAAELGSKVDDDLSFPSLMSHLCRIKGRRELLLRIKRRFDYLTAFPEVYRSASRFHRELASVPFLEQIFTTNWDELFEWECGAVPFVGGEDFAFWDLPGRKVFKLHGSVSHYGSIVATEEDYARCLEKLQSGLIGSTLKLALATKVIVFVGYSVRDPDFLQTLDLVREEVGSVAPSLYAVTLWGEDCDRLQAMGIKPIVTDATFFIEELKKGLVTDGVMIDDSWISEVSEILDWANEAHDNIIERFNCVEYPSLVYTLSYQDGLRHGLEWLLAKSSAGECSHSCDVIGRVKTYATLRDRKMKERNYVDVAYVDGYSNALMLPLVSMEERTSVPLFYLFGSREDIFDIEDLALALPESRELHRAAYKKAVMVVAKTGNDPEISFHHMPVL